MLAYDGFAHGLHRVTRQRHEELGGVGVVHHGHVRPDLVEVPLQLHRFDPLQSGAEPELFREPVETGVGGGEIVDCSPRLPNGVRALGALCPEICSVLVTLVVLLTS